MRYILFHYANYHHLWRQEGLFQCGPNVHDGLDSFNVAEPRVDLILDRICTRDFTDKSILIHYTDPFILRSHPLTGLSKWTGPRLLVCGDLHHGPSPVDTLKSYLLNQFHDGVLLAFNPSHLDVARNEISVPVVSCPPSFFRYPKPERLHPPNPLMVHVGSLGMHHQKRNQLVQSLLSRKRVPFAHFTTKTAAEASAIYAQSSLVLNVPLNNDLNHRFFEAMAAGAPQLVVGNPKKILGSHIKYLNRKDIIWAEDIESIERVANNFLSNQHLCPSALHAPPEYPINELVRFCLCPDFAKPPQDCKLDSAAKSPN